MLFRNCHIFLLIIETIVISEVYSDNSDLVKLDKIPNYPGLYFVPQYWFSVSSETWNVVYNLPLKPLEDRMNVITKVWNEIQKSKQQQNWLYVHEPRLDMLKHSWLKLTNLYVQLEHLLWHKHRTKRGLFNSLGKVVKFITGNMDADDADYYNAKLNTIALDNKNIYQLEREQLTLVQNTLWAVNKTTLNMQDNQSSLIKAHKYLEKVSLYNTERIKNLTLLYNRQTEIIEEIDIMQELIIETHEMLRTLYDSIDEARKGRLSSYLVKPVELLEILDSIKSSLHVGDSLPIEVTQENVYKYYSLVKVVAYFVNSDLRYVISIPLNHIARRYQLFKVIQVPEIQYSQDPKSQVYAQLFIFPEKTTEYLAFSENLQYYILPTDRELSKCTEPPNIICNDIHIIFPTRDTGASHARCEVEVFRNLSSPHCNYKLVKLINPVWEHIPYSNVWIFAAVPNNEHVTVTCKNDKGVMYYLTDLTLPSKGKLTLSPECMATGSSFTLLTQDTKQNTYYPKNGLDLVIPNVNVTLSTIEHDILAEYDNFSKQHKELVLKHVTHQMNDLNTASIRINKLKEMMTNFKPTTFDVDPDEANVYNMTILIILLLVILMYIMSKCGIIKRVRICILPNEDNSQTDVQLALGDIVPAQGNVTNETESNPTEEIQNAPRRSRRLIRIRP